VRIRLHRNVGGAAANRLPHHVPELLERNRFLSSKETEKVHLSYPHDSRRSLQVLSRAFTASWSEVRASSIWRSSGWVRRETSMPESAGRKSIMRCAVGKMRDGVSEVASSKSGTGDSPKKRTR